MENNDGGQKQNQEPYLQDNSKSKEEYIPISPQNIQKSVVQSQIKVLAAQNFHNHVPQFEQSAVRLQALHTEQLFVKSNSQNKQENEEDSPKKENPSIIQELQKQWIIKNAQLERIGGTYDFFTYHLEKYKKHLNSRKTVINNVNGALESYRMKRSLPMILLKQYFKDYSQLCSQFHEKSYKFQYPQKIQSQNRIINTRVQLKPGFEKLSNLRKQSGYQMSKLDKFMKNNTIPNLQKNLDMYWNNVGSQRSKMLSKKELFQEKQKKFHKRIEKIGKVYTKGRFGQQLNQDVFQQMIKFVKEQRQLRNSILSWSKQIMPLRKSFMNADLNYFNDLQSQLNQYKSFNSTVYQLKKRKSNFVQKLKQNIHDNFQYSSLCTPTDNDYILNIINFKTKNSLASLKQQNYENFFSEEYFQQVIGQTTQFLKGTIVKSFPLKNIEEQLVRTVSGNLVHFNKRTLDIKYKMRIDSTVGVFQGNGCVCLTETIKGIIFDSTKQELAYFKDDNRAEELIIYLGGDLNLGIQ